MASALLPLMAALAATARAAPTAPVGAAASAVVESAPAYSLSVWKTLGFIGAVWITSSGAKAVAPHHAHARISRWTYVLVVFVFTLFIGHNARRLSDAGDITVLRFFQFILAGGICAFVTHAACTPIDVIKTRLQTNPGSYDGGFHALQKILRSEGPRALLTGLGATASGYFLHGAFKYSFYELFKLILVDDPATAVEPPLYISALAGFLAECVACVLLTPMEAIRIRSVADSNFPGGVLEGLQFLYEAEGLYGLYKGLPSVLLKQVPYTVGQFVAYEYAIFLVKLVAKRLFGSLDTISKSGAAANATIAGLMAGVIAGILSQPGDTILSKINQGESEGSPLQQIVVTARALGFSGLFLGLGARLLQVSCMIGGQFLIYDSVKLMCGITTASAVPPGAVASNVAQGLVKKLL